MDFRANDPGAVQFGNFINYYQFNSAEERTNLLPDHVWTVENELKSPDESPYLILDVGCNAGNFTQLLLEFVSKRVNREVQILGVDIDPSLIDRAKANNKSQQIEFQCVDITRDDDFTRIKKYLELRNQEKFDAVCCFSITMWIHLNNHDDGLREFLEKCADIAELFVVEPQPWKCYRTAVRRMKRSAEETFPYYTALKWRTNVEDEIQNYLETKLKRKKIHETNPTKWMRKICFYR